MFDSYWGHKATMNNKIPQQILNILNILAKNNFEAYLVGGCVRDLILKKNPKDWDITTNAIPSKILEIFPDSFYKNTFGTVCIKIPTLQNNLVKEFDIIEITTYRKEFGYSDNRRPDRIVFAKKLQTDLKRRDFTMNAMALEIKNASFSIIDLFNGQKDLENKIIRAVGDPKIRFGEDALRMMRAIRFYAQLSENSEWEIENKTFLAIKENAFLLNNIAKERIRDEFIAIIKSNNAYEGVLMLQKTNLLHYIIPEIENGIGIKQNRHHIYTIYEHLLLSLKNCPSTKLEVRLAALFHDIAKPQTKRGDGEFSTFYNHDHIGARTAEKILTRLKFKNETIQKVKLLVDNHMFYYNPGEVTEASVRRLIKKVGTENIKDLIDLRIADRLGSGTPKAKPYKLRHLEYLIEKVSSDAISVKMLKINGNDLIKKLNIKPGPKIGAVLDVLLFEVINDPKKNTFEALLLRSSELLQIDTAELRKMAKEKIEEKLESDNKKIKSRHWVN